MKAEVTDMNVSKLMKIWFKDSEFHRAHGESKTDPSSMFIMYQKHFLNCSSYFSLGTELD